MSGMSDWRYYNHGWISTLQPHETPDTQVFQTGELFKYGGVLARYTTDFDCENQTGWWYIIKDTPYDISALNAKKRWTVKQGEKNFDVKIIEPLEYSKELFDVAVAAFSAYPKKYRPTLVYEEYCNDVNTWLEKGMKVYGAFSKETDKLAGYAVLGYNKDCIDLNILKTNPAYEKKQVNAGLLYKIMLDFNELKQSPTAVEHNYYICNGSRSILHETHFDDYLEKYFGFRKVYCNLHIEYNPKYRGLIKFLYIFRGLFKKFDFINKVHQLNGVLLMESIVRGSKKLKAAN